MAKKKTLWVFDKETDPFKYGRIPAPFAICALSEFGDRYIFWGDDCLEKFKNFLEELDDALLLAHNGGRFDAIFVKDLIHGEMLLVDGRIIKCNIKKGVEIRDSFAILPMPLAKIKTADGSKLEIDYNKMERENREKHKAEIIRYLIQDCVTLLSAVQNFYDRAGSRKLTIASQASSELRAIYPDLPKLPKIHFDEFSPFFFGGRVQAFQKGIITGKKKLYDVNSMYPARMAYDYHPYTDSYCQKEFNFKNMPENDCGFFMGTLDANGCFPVRQKNHTTPYLVGENLDVKITIHELKAAMDCGLTKNIRGSLIIPNFSTKFDKFILPHYESRKRAQAIGDEGGSLYHKLIPNSSYGRFAMSPDGREEIYFAWPDEDISEKKLQGWKIKDVDLDSQRIILSRDVSRPWMFYEDVATGASITGAARATLMRGLHSAKGALYCDTDSIMCTEFSGKVGKELGEWKEELIFDEAAIAGKKMYALFNEGECVKTASKGVKATPAQIREVANGATITIYNDAPVMRLAGTKFIHRDIRIT